VEPTGYGLGKSGWVTARIKSGANFDIDTMKGWIAQSYRAVAPKKLAKLLE
jgi:predicted DNA-binding protein (MmcQ/YjbR family)